MLKMAAANNAVHHLEKLVKDGFAEKIEEEDTRWNLKKTGNLLNVQNKEASTKCYETFTQCLLPQNINQV
ncbi:hypothetical protein AM593_09594, partial [Mytilus galloprovincialis]